MRKRIGFLVCSLGMMMLTGDLHAINVSKLKGSKTLNIIKEKLTSDIAKDAVFKTTGLSLAFVPPLLVGLGIDHLLVSQFHPGSVEQIKEALATADTGYAQEVYDTAVRRLDIVRAVFDLGGAFSTFYYFTQDFLSLANESARK